MSLQTLPKGLLLDFGGVIVNSEKPANWQQLVADEFLALVGSEPMVSRDRLIADITAGAVAAGLWRNAMSRPRHPKELDQRTYAMDFIAADWPEDARKTMGNHYQQLCYLVSSTKEHRELREGITELLAWCNQIGLPVAVVSNAMCGQVHRDYLAEQGLSDYFVAELYSDECELRKPNPDFLHLGAQALCLSAADCWYVGDHLDRDVLCGVRAGIGGNVLMPSPGSAKRPYTVEVTADLVVATPKELLNEMRKYSV